MLIPALIFGLALVRGGDYTAPLPYAELVTYVDKLDAAWIATNGTSGSGYGLGDGTFGGSKKQGDLATLVAGSGNISSQAILAPTASRFPNNTAALNYAASFYGFYSGLNQLANATGVATNLDSLMAYYNSGAGGPWNCLAPPEWINLFNALTGVNPSPANVYAVVLQGSTYTNGLGKYVLGTGYSAPTPSVGVLNSSGYIDTTKYAGGAPIVSWSSATGSGTCTITVTGKNQAGTTESYTWSGTFAASNAGTALTPGTTATDLIIGTTNISTTGFTGTPTFYVGAQQPAGRTYPPT